MALSKNDSLNVLGQVQTREAAKFKQVWLREYFLGGPGRPPSLSGNPTPNRCSMSQLLRTPCSFEYSPVL